VPYSVLECFGEDALRQSIQIAQLLFQRSAQGIGRKRSAAPPQLSLTYNKSLSRTQCK